MGCEFGEGLVGVIFVGEVVGEDVDMMVVVDLVVGDVEDVMEDVFYWSMYGV